MDITKTGIVTMLAFGASVVATGAEFHIKHGITDWTSPESYSENAVPNAGDTVYIPDCATGTVYSTDAASCQKVSSLGRIWPLGTKLRSTIVFDVAAGDAVTNNSPVFGKSSGYGGLIKTGAGELVMNSPGVLRASPTSEPLPDLRVNVLRVENGILRGALSSERGAWYFGNVYLAEGTEFHLPLFDWTKTSTTAQFFTMQTLTGDGTLFYDDETHSEQQCRITETCSFNGKFYGPRLKVFVQGNVALTGIETSCLYEFMVGSNDGRIWNKDPGSGRVEGIVGVTKFGKKGEAGSIGDVNVFSTDHGAGGYLYLGSAPETVDRQFRTVNTASGAKGPSFIDAGAYGGLTFTGDWCMKTDDPPDLSGHLMLLGSNIVECVLTNNINSWSFVDGATTNRYAYHITKRGSGAWRFADCHNQTWNGALSVEEGCIRFNSIREINEWCALGRASLLEEPYLTQSDLSKRVPWAYRLGTVDAAGNLVEGELEYVGSDPNGGHRRAVALAGAGRLKASGAGSLMMHNVYGLGTGGRRLTLDGVVGTTNLLVDISDSNACVSVVKEGAGQWIIGGELGFSGDLTVKAGTLTVRDDRLDHYTWFRFTVKRTQSGQTTVNMQDLALYDAEGRRRNVGLQCWLPDPYPDSGKTMLCYHTGDEQYVLEPGWAAYGAPRRYKYEKQSTNFSAGKEADMRRLFDDISSGSQTGFSMYCYDKPSGGSTLKYSPDDPGTWLKIVMRLAEDVPPIVAYDYCRGSMSAAENNGHPVYFGLEGSIDGFVWDELHNATPDDDRSSAQGVTSYAWISDGSAFKNSSTLRPGLGYRLSKTKRTLAVEPLSRVGKVSVAPGATLRTDTRIPLRNLSVDVAGAGTVEGFSISDAEGSTLEVSNFPVGGFESHTLPLTFVDVDGLENLKRWTLKLDGESTKRRITLVGNRIAIAPVGLTIRFR